MTPYNKIMVTKLIIFGITGDLSRRKLIPALRQIVASGTVREFEVIGVSRREVLADELVGPELADITSIVSMDLAEPADYINLFRASGAKDGNEVIIYLSVPPLAVTQIARQLGAAGFARPNVKLLFEKPFGMDEVSAQDMIQEITGHFDERMIYRIDHYLAKEMAQNIIAFRAGNALISGIWNTRHIQMIEVVASEKIGIEGRVEFYEQTGALRDVLQGHLMQLLALVLAKVPEELDWSELPKARARALAALQPADPRKSVRGQYDTYRGEVSNDHSLVETYVRTTLFSSDPVWHDVPLILTTGKALSEKMTEVRVHFRKSHIAQANCLRFRIQPDERVEIDLYAKKPGYDRELEHKALTFSYPDDTVLPDAYEQVLVDAFRGDKSAFATSEEILASWHALQPLLDAWAIDDAPLIRYETGSPYDDLQHS